MPTLVAEPVAFPTAAAAKQRRGPLAKATPNVWVEAVEAPFRFDPHLAAWEELARSAPEPNAFYEPWMLRPAVEAFAANLSLRFAFVYRMDQQGSPLLIGFFPCEVRRRYKGLPIRVLSLWRYRHCFLCTPLLHGEHGKAALKAYFDWTRADRKGAHLLDFAFVHAEGPFQQLLVDFQSESGCLSFVDETWNRALLQLSQDRAVDAAASLSGPRRGELRRLRKRLADLGRLETRILEPGGNIQSWIEQFLALEASGWKGQERTALLSSPVEQTYFATIARAAFARGQLLMLGLFLDDRPIALKCNFLAGHGSFAFKIAFDEAYARYSPGVQLELDNIQELERRPELRWMDSCALPGHFMIGRLWHQRRTLQSVALSTGRLGGDLLVSALPFLRVLRRRWRRAQ
jgi:CelD/BcsL family acetyltransferase involved in cellulose biosynthesis